MTLPVVLATSVIRGAREGRVHGGLYRVDLATGHSELVRDWDDPSISWADRGGERGLRGVGFTATGCWAAAANSLLRLNPRTFATADVFEHPHLGNNHEIWVEGGHVLVTATEFDRVVRFDTATGRFAESVRLCKAELVRTPGLRRLLYQTTGNERFWVDPGAADLSQEAERSDQCHLNSIRATTSGVEVCGTKVRHIVRIHKERVETVARVPLGTHNAVLDRGELIFNDTERGRIVIRRGRGTIEMRPPHDAGSTARCLADPLVARPDFCRGLVALPSLVIGGSSPARITAYDRRTGQVLQSVGLSDDVTNAIHGVVVVPAAR